MTLKSFSRTSNNNILSILMKNVLTSILHRKQTWFRHWYKPWTTYGVQFKRPLNIYSQALHFKFYVHPTMMSFLFLEKNILFDILNHRKRMWFRLLTIDSLRSSAYILATRSWSIWWSLGWTLFLQYTMYFFSRSCGTGSTVDVVFSECCKQRGSV